MTKIKVAINGFGRIGRLAYRQIYNMTGIDIVRINDLTSPEVLAHLAKYDTAQGRFNDDLNFKRIEQIRENISSSILVTTWHNIDYFHKELQFLYWHLKQIENKALFKSRLKNIIKRLLRIYKSKIIFQEIKVMISTIIPPKLFFNYVDDTDANGLKFNPISLSII